MSEEQGNWFDAFPEDVQQWNEVKDSDDMSGFLERMGNHRKHLGQSIRIPTKEASTDDWSAFHEKLGSQVEGLMPTPSSDDADGIKNVLKKLGLPDEAAGYENVEGDGISFTDGQLDNIKDLALNAGLTRAQYAALARQIGTKQNEDMATVSDAQKAQQDAIGQEWGLAAEAKLKEIEGFLKQSSAPQNLIDTLENKSLDSDTAQWLSALAQGMGEKSEFSTQSRSTSETAMLTPYEAQERINEILSNRDHVYHKGDKAAGGRMRELRAMLNNAA